LIERPDAACELNVRRLPVDVKRGARIPGDGSVKAWQNGPVRLNGLIWHHTTLLTGHDYNRRCRMARPNFKYEKRQKELAKQKKAEEKRLKKLERRSGKAAEEDAVEAVESNDETNDATSPSGDTE
jgi:hypothetical protein